MPNFLGFDYIYPVTKGSRRNVQGDDTISYSARTTETPGQRFYFSIGLEPSGLTEAESPLEAHYAAFYNTRFEIPVPNNPPITQKNASVRAVTVANQAAERTNRFQFTSRSSGGARAWTPANGEYIRLVNHNKIYIITSTRHSTSITGGVEFVTGTLIVAPNILVTAPDGTGIVIDPNVVVRYANPSNLSLTLTRTGYAMPRIEVEEAYA